MAIANGVMMQCFHCYSPAGGLWNDLAAKAADLAAAGLTAVWIPPAYKGASGASSVGYDVYDLFDLGEFNQKDTTPTKYGSKAELIASIEAVHRAGLQVYADVVFNQKDGADFTEDVLAQQVEWNDRNATKNGWYMIKAWTRFEFPGRGDTYSAMKWSWTCFDAVSCDENLPRPQKFEKLLRLKDKVFSTDVSKEKGNYDYLCCADCDVEGAVADEFYHWGEWLIRQTHIDGFRIDAAKHIRSSFFPGWLDHLRSTFRLELFAVGEYWSADVEDLKRFIDATGGSMSLFDVPLHYNLQRASNAGESYDMRTIFERTLVKEQPVLAVTFVDNHDTMPCQSLESWVQPWFKPLAYALILLRQGGYPCVFTADYYPCPSYGDSSREVRLESYRALIDMFLDARRKYGYGDQHDSFDDPRTVGWVRTGDGAHPGVMAVLMTTGSGGSKWMNTFRPGAAFIDVTGNVPGVVTADANGWANFSCCGQSVSVWVH